MPVPAGSGSGPAPPGLSYDQTLSRVRLSAQVASSTAFARVERSQDEVRWTIVRGGTAVTPGPGSVVAVDDYEFAADVANHYRVRAFLDSPGFEGFEIGPAKNSNPYIETDASGWTAVGGSVVRSTAQAHEGIASLLLTPDGVTGVVQARTVNIPVTAGNFYVASCWMLSTVSRTAGISIIWRDDTNAILSQMLGDTVSMSAGVWTYHEVIGQAPAGATQATFVAASMSGTPPVDHTIYVDEACFVVVGFAGPQFAGTVTPVLDKVWLKSIGRPFLNRTVRVRDYSEFTRTSRSGTFDVVGRSLPVAVTDVRSSKRFTLEVYADDAADARNLDLVLASGDIMFLHVPSTGRLSTVPGGYVAVGDTSELVLPTADLKLRVFALPCTIVAAPGPEVVGVTYTCQGVLNDYATCTDLLAAFATILDLLDNVGSAEDVIVP